MRVCVLGAGSLGSVIGAMLARSGHDVTLVTRNDAHVSAIRRRGLLLVDDRERREVAVGAATSVDGLTPPDLLVVLVKSFDTRSAMEEAADLVGDDTLVLTLQNGVGCDEIIAEIVGADRVIAGRTFVGGRLTEPGVVEYGVEGRMTVLGELDGRVTDRLRVVADAFEASGMAVEISADIVAMAWEKLFVNVATGAWSALTGLPYGELSVHPEIERMAIATVQEAIDVARALGVGVTTSDPQVPWRRAWEGLPYGFKASMLQSVEKGSQTEVDVMHGAVTAGGRRAGVPTPVNDALVAAVHGLELRLRLERESRSDSPATLS
ncbi:MAG: ketopantoate reductase family protein [Ilumatobacteraceae bacterium]|nr:ketopantoate reductase family protein [Ilumatobacteraceae bacterium]